MNKTTQSKKANQVNKTVILKYLEAHGGDGCSIFSVDYLSGFGFTEKFLLRLVKTMKSLGGLRDEYQLYESQKTGATGVFRGSHTNEGVAISEATGIWNINMLHAIAAYLHASVKGSNSLDKAARNYTGAIRAALRKPNNRDIFNDINEAVFIHPGKVTDDPLAFVKNLDYLGFSEEGLRQLKQDCRIISEVKLTGRPFMDFLKHLIADESPDAVIYDIVYHTRGTFHATKENNEVLGEIFRNGYSFEGLPGGLGIFKRRVVPTI